MSLTRQMRRHAERQAKKGRAPRASSQAPATVERLEACALYRDGQLHTGFKSHSDLRASLGDEDPYRARMTDDYGFLTSEDRFVDRQEAKQVATLAGQCSPQQRELLSSDINW